MNHVPGTQLLCGNTKMAEPVSPALPSMENGRGLPTVTLPVKGGARSQPRPVLRNGGRRVGRPVLSLLSHAASLSGKGPLGDHQIVAEHLPHPRHCAGSPSQGSE